MQTRAMRNHERALTPRQSKCDTCGSRRQAGGEDRADSNHVRPRRHRSVQGIDRHARGCLAAEQMLRIWLHILWPHTAHGTRHTHARQPSAKRVGVGYEESEGFGSRLRRSSCACYEGRQPSSASMALRHSRVFHSIFSDVTSD